MEKYYVLLDKEPGIAALCKTSLELSDMVKMPFRHRGARAKFSLVGPEARCFAFDKNNDKEQIKKIMS